MTEFNPNMRFIDYSTGKDLTGKKLAQARASYEKFSKADQPDFSETYEGIPDTHPSNRSADIVVNGKKVATVYNKGGVQSTNEIASMVLGMDRTGLSPQQIASKIAAAVGGTVTAPRDWD